MAERINVRPLDISVSADRVVYTERSSDRHRDDRFNTDQHQLLRIRISGSGEGWASNDVPIVQSKRAYCVSDTFTTIRSLLFFMTSTKRTTRKARICPFVTLRKLTPAEFTVVHRKNATSRTNCPPTHASNRLIKECEWRTLFIGPFRCSWRTVNVLLAFT